MISPKAPGLKSRRHCSGESARSNRARRSMRGCAIRVGQEGRDELDAIGKLVAASGYGSDRIRHRSLRRARPRILHRPGLRGRTHARNQRRKRSPGALRLCRWRRALRRPRLALSRRSAGGVDMTGEENAVVAIEELVVHGWDVARVSGQELRAPAESLGHVESFLDDLRRAAGVRAGSLRTPRRRRGGRLAARALPGCGRSRPGLESGPRCYALMTVSSNVVAVKRTRTSTSSPTSGTAPRGTGTASRPACAAARRTAAACRRRCTASGRTRPRRGRRLAIRAARSFSVAPPVGASRPMPCAVPPDTTRIVPAAGAVRLR